MPLTTDGGKAFPARDIVQFLTYVVVVVTLVPASFLLPPLLTKLGLAGDREAAREEVFGRRYAVQRAQETLDRVADGDLGVEGRKRLQAYYHAQVRRLEGVTGGEDDTAFAQWRTAATELVTTRQIDRAAAERVQRDLDLDVERLMAEND